MLGAAKTRMTGVGKPVILSVSNVYARWNNTYNITIQLDPDSILTSTATATAAWNDSNVVTFSDRPVVDGAITFVSPTEFNWLDHGTVINWTVKSILESDIFQQTVTSLPSGGSVENKGKDRIHRFDRNNTFTVPEGFEREMRVLMIAGGGGGGGKESGGGGGGGMIDTTIFVPAGTHSITVGVGGQGGYGGYKERDNGLNGTNSVFLNQTAIGGGGGGGTGRLVAPGNGGSGGGAGHGVAPGQGTPGQGYAGGSYSNNQGSSGGGGAGGVGGNQVGLSRGGHGGPGRYSDIEGTSYAYAGGGGGCLNTDYGSSDSLQGKGGVGGGGNSGKGNQVIYPGSPVNGKDLYGGGGGSGGWSGDWFSGQTGGKGGNGIVIIRFTVA